MWDANLSSKKPLASLKMTSKYNNNWVNLLHTVLICTYTLKKSDYAQFLSIILWTYRCNKIEWVEVAKCRSKLLTLYLWVCSDYNTNVTPKKWTWKILQNLFIIMHMYNKQTLQPKPIHDEFREIAIFTIKRYLQNPFMHAI